MTGSVLDFGDKVLLLDQMIGQNLLAKKRWVYYSFRQCETLKHLFMLKVLCQNDQFAHWESRFPDWANHNCLVQQLRKFKTWLLDFVSIAHVTTVGAHSTRPNAALSAVHPLNWAVSVIAVFPLLRLRAQQLVDVGWRVQFIDRVFRLIFFFDFFHL